MSTVVKIAGFSGHILVDGVQLLSNSASISTDYSPTFINYADIKRDTNPRNRVKYAPGTRVSSGSVSFDVTATALTNLLQTNKLFQRNYTFDVKIYDGNQGKQLTSCLVTSLSLSGSVGGLITGSLSFTSKNDPSNYNGSGGSFLSPLTTTPYGYWYSGSATYQVNDWSLDYSQSVSAVHLNQIGDADNALPRYMKVQTQETSLKLNTYDEISSTNQIVVATKTFTIVGTKTSKGYSFNGPTNVGTFSYDFASAAITAPDETILS